jgi:hypothetical protein
VRAAETYRAARRNASRLDGRPRPWGPQPRRRRFDWREELAEARRIRAITVRCGVGRPVFRRYTVIPGPSIFEVPVASRRPLRDALQAAGSQRKAAAALGLNLSTFQRRLKKEEASDA